jgi:hypothetical protein
MFLRYNFCGCHIETVATEMRCSRANVYHHCDLIFDDYEFNSEFRRMLAPILDEDAMKILRDKHHDKKRPV